MLEEKRDFHDQIYDHTLINADLNLPFKNPAFKLHLASVKAPITPEKKCSNQSRETEQGFGPKPEHTASRQMTTDYISNSNLFQCKEEKKKFRKKFGDNCSILLVRPLIMHRLGLNLTTIQKGVLGSSSCEMSSEQNLLLCQLETEFLEALHHSQGEAPLFFKPPSEITLIQHKGSEESFVCVNSATAQQPKTSEGFFSPLSSSPFHTFLTPYSAEQPHPDVLLLAYTKRTQHRDETPGGSENKHKPGSNFLSATKECQPFSWSTWGCHEAPLTNISGNFSHPGSDRARIALRVRSTERGRSENARSTGARIVDTHKCVAERRFFTAFLRLVTPRTNSILLHLSAKPQCPLSATKVWEKEAFPLGVTMRASDPLVLVKIQSMNTLKAAEHRRIPERVFGPLGKSHNAIICEMGRSGGCPRAADSLRGTGPLRFDVAGKLLEKPWQDSVLPANPNPASVVPWLQPRASRASRCCSNTSAALGTALPRRHRADAAGANRPRKQGSPGLLGRMHAAKVNNDSSLSCTASNASQTYTFMILMSPQSGLVPAPVLLHAVCSQQGGSLASAQQQRQFLDVQFAVRKKLEATTSMKREDWRQGLALAVRVQEDLSAGDVHCGRSFVRI
ncbi:hypothetical protein Anapl_05413 [Anas platyrhynchos]|uniref:Uncharacterized protein n=1 Tax=Anas platyrhynchos TaxID=8839 RepID=R0L3Y9_ANAPL|nr:hypothetical protein Anapl_05413 [Anas platyrhynchos]